MRTFFALMAAVALAAGGDSHKLTLEDLLSAEPVGDAALSPDGNTFAIVRSGQIALLPSGGGWPVTLTSTPGAKSGLSWSPDSRTLAYASQGSIWTVPADGGSPKRLTHAYPGEGDPRQASDRVPQWSPKGRWILFQTGRRGHEDLMVVSDDGRTEYYLTQSEADAGNANWAPDGSHISYTERKPEYFSGKLEVVRFDPRTGQADDPPRSTLRPRTAAAAGRSARQAGPRIAAPLRWFCRIAAGTTCTWSPFPAARPAPSRAASTRISTRSSRPTGNLWR